METMLGLLVPVLLLPGRLWVAWLVWPRCLSPARLLRWLSVGWVALTLGSVPLAVGWCRMLGRVSLRRPWMALAMLRIRAGTSCMLLVPAAGPRLSLCRGRMLWTPQGGAAGSGRNPRRG